ncbi:AraC family transcriptional regulator [Kineococcus glutinatus]|uniref:AraC family transcriptional regulator n=1 Tax=Kineococcus glutinatus TaxID=1070872 RepID=A0ABP9HWH9_9ACTN
MDALAGLLDGPRARGAFVLRSQLDPPWALRVADRAPLTVVVVVRGSAWLVPDDAGPLPLGPGDAAVLRGPEPYTVADAPGTRPQVVIGEDQRCRGVDGGEAPGMSLWDVRTWGNSPEGSTVLLTGTYQVGSEVGRGLLRALPARLTVPAGELDGPLVRYLAAEATRDAPGQEAVLDRLVDVLLVAVLRAWFARDGNAPGWYRAHGDPVVGPALRLLQAEPARRWTVAELAGEVGVSRAALARRFAELVGEPPMAFLTGWRLGLAADLLREPGSTLEQVARRVGYGSGFALSAAFTRVRGVSPREHRAGAAAP